MLRNTIDDLYYYKSSSSMFHYGACMVYMYGISCILCLFTFGLFQLLVFFTYFFNVSADSLDSFVSDTIYDIYENITEDELEKAETIEWNLLQAEMMLLGMKRRTQKYYDTIYFQE